MNGYFNIYEVGATRENLVFVRKLLKALRDASKAIGKKYLILFTGKYGPVDYFHIGFKPHAKQVIYSFYQYRNHVQDANQYGHDIDDDADYFIDMYITHPVAKGWTNKKEFQIYFCGNYCGGCGNCQYCSVDYQDKDQTDKPKSIRQNELLLWS